MSQYLCKILQNANEVCEMLYADILLQSKANIVLYYILLREWKLLIINLIQCA